MTIRITKAMAENAALKMRSEAYDKKIDALQKEIDAEIEKLVKKYIPAPVIACVNEYGDYFCAINQASVTTLKHNGCAESYIYGNLSFNLVNACNNIKVSKSDYDKVRTIYDKKNNLKKESGNFYEKVINALVQLRTYSNVEKNLPEAIKYLDIPSTGMVPAPVYSDLNDFIKSIKKN